MPLTSFGSTSAAGSSIAGISPQAVGVSSEATVAAVEVASEEAGIAPPRPRPRGSPLPRPRLPLPSTKSARNVNMLWKRTSSSTTTSFCSTVRNTSSTSSCSSSSRTFRSSRNLWFLLHRLFLDLSPLRGMTYPINMPTLKCKEMIPVAILSVAESTSPSASCNANTKSSAVQSGNTSLNTFN